MGAIGGANWMRFSAEPARRDPARALLERVCPPSLIDWFEAVTEKQYTRDLLFSSAIELMQCGGLQSL